MILHIRRRGIGSDEGEQNAIFRANGIVPSRDAGNDYAFKVEEEPG